MLLVKSLLKTSTRNNNGKKREPEPPKARTITYTARTASTQKVGNPYFKVVGINFRVCVYWHFAQNPIQSSMAPNIRITEPL